MNSALSNPKNIDADDRHRGGAPAPPVTLRGGPEIEYQLLFEQNPIPMWVFDRATLCFLAVNDAALRQYGYTREEFLSMTLAEIRPPEFVSELRNNIERRQPGHLRSGPWIHCRKDGSTIEVEIVSRDLEFQGIRGVLVAAHDITAIKQAESAAREAQDKYTAIFDDAVIGIFRATPDGRPLSVNRAMAQMHGYSTPEELLSKVSNVAAQLFVDPTHLFALHRAAANGIVRNAEVEVYQKDGSRRWMKVNLRTARDPAGNVLAIEGTVEDITERKRVEEILLFKNALLEAQSETTLDGILVVDENDRIVLVNRQFKSQFAVSDELVEQGDDLLPRSHVLHQVEDPDAFLERVNDLYRHPETKSRDELKLRDGRTFDRYSAPLVDSRGEHRGRIWYFRDITERKRAEEQVKFLAYYDSLTGLPNRTLLIDRLENALAGARRRNENVAVLFMDLDHFKVINDSLGHAFGDMLLNQVGARLKACVREQDTVARVGGDEFVLVLNAPGDTSEISATAARIVRAMTERMTVDGRSMATSCSLGISIFPQNSSDAATLIKYADQAMYSAKGNGRGSFAFFTDALNTQAVQRLSLENDLRAALEKEEFFLLYQPQVSLATGEITGVEALIRWRHPRLGIVSPLEFIPVSEDNGLIHPIGEWVLRTACAQVRQWQQARIPLVPVAVNVSAAQFRQEGFCSLLRNLLEETCIPPRYIELELTESLMISNQDVTHRVMRELKQIGVHLAIDDFGTGYSGLSYLRQFRVDKLKIDRSFIHDLAIDRDDAAITAAIISLGKTLNLTVVAEGVEEEAQISILQDHSCDQAQGYYFSRPVSSEEITSKLETEPYRHTCRLITN
jgi:diguanylate cyclase (GGDEF)-like protein/PAS domain S-box-containing protein